MSLTEVFFPVFSLGTLLTGMVTFGLLANDRRNHGMYWGVFLLLGVSLVSISFDTAVLVVGGIHRRFTAAVQLSRLHELATTAFVFAIPFYFELTLPPTRWQRRASVVASRFGMIVFAIVLVAAFAAPDLFVSVTRQSTIDMSAAYTNSFGRGAEGPLFVVRDAAFGVMILFSLLVAATAALDRQITGPDLLIVGGIAIGVLLGASAVYANFTGRYPGLMDGIPFSRVGLGLTIFTLLATASYVLRYTSQAKLLDERNRELQHRRDRLAFLTYHDETTQMLNDQAFVRDVETYLGAESPPAASTHLIDIINFRDVIDTYGKATSDRILRILGRRIEQTVLQFGGTDARIYRLSADRFTVFIPQEVPERGLRLFENSLFDAVGMPIAVDDHSIYLSANAGQCRLSIDLTDAEDLLRRLRSALGEARRTGTAVYRWTDALESPSFPIHGLSQALRHALEKDEFSLLYQPIVDRRGRVIAAEALVRWDRARPDQFIPVAEETGLIVRLTTHIIGLLEADLPRLNASIPDLRVYINVSARNISSLDLPQRLRDVLERVSLPASAIGVEITETSFGDLTGEFIDVLNALRASGITVAIDDFGTGYSSLAYIRHLPADRLKIDRSFIRDLPGSREDATVVDSIIVLARRLHKQVVAEGVETRAQYEYLRTREVEFFQGFYFATPLSCEDFVWTVTPAMDLD